MRLIVIVLLMSLLAISIWAGTFRDNFNDGNFRGWTTPFGGEWSVKDGAVLCQHSSKTVVLSIGEPDWEDYTVTFDGKIESHNGMYAIGGMIRSDERNFNDVYFCLARTLVGGDRIETGVSEAQQPVGTIINDNFSLELDKWYNFRATLMGTQFDFFLDNELVISVDYNDYPLPQSGKFSLWSRWADKSYFDNVVITGNDVPDLNLSVTPKSKLTNTWGRIKHDVP
jgi:hypothetical protein